MGLFFQVYNAFHNWRLLQRIRLGCAVSPPICKTLAFDALQGVIRTLAIGRAKIGAVALTEIKLCQIAVQVTPVTVLIDALQAALEDAVEALDRVRAGIAANVLVHVPWSTTHGWQVTCPACGSSAPRPS